MKKNAIEKFLNSSFIKDIYPMVDHISVTEINEDNGTMKYDIFLNTSDITYNTMYDHGFDPHYLNDYHVKEAMKFFSMDLPFRSFDVYLKNGDYLVGFKNTKSGVVFYKSNPIGMKSVDLI